MAVVFECVKAGDILWDCHYEMGQAVVSWNHNEPRTVGSWYFKKLRRAPAKGCRA